MKRGMFLIGSATLISATSVGIVINKENVRKVVALFMIFVMLFTSCNKVNYYHDSSTIVDAQDLRGIHKSTVKDFHNDSLAKSDLDDETKQRAEKLYLSNVEYVNEHGLEALLTKNGINPKVLQALELYLLNREDDSIYKRIALEFDLTRSDATFMFNMLQVYDVITADDDVAALSGACVAAIAGTVMTTLAVGAVTGGWGLGLFLGSKALGYYGVYSSCK